MSHRSCKNKSHAFPGDSAMLPSMPLTVWPLRRPTATCHGPSLDTPHQGRIFHATVGEDNKHVPAGAMQPTGVGDLWVSSLVASEWIEQSYFFSPLQGLLQLCPPLPCRVLVVCCLPVLLLSFVTKFQSDRDTDLLNSLAAKSDPWLQVDSGPNPCEA